MITVMEEPADLCVGTLCQLFHEHGKAVMGPGFNLNLLLFAKAVQSGVARVIVARDENHEAVGYAFFNIYRDCMRAHETAADCQAIYVKPQYRGRVSIRIIREAERVLKAAGVNRLYMHVPSSTPEVAGMFLKPAMGYKPMETTLQKEL